MTGGPPLHSNTLFQSVCISFPQRDITTSHACTPNQPANPKLPTHHYCTGYTGCTGYRSYGPILVERMTLRES